MVAFVTPERDRERESERKGGRKRDLSSCDPATTSVSYYKFRQGQHVEGERDEGCECDHHPVVSSDRLKVHFFVCTRRYFVLLVVLRSDSGKDLSKG